MIFFFHFAQPYVYMYRERVVAGGAAVSGLVFEHDELLQVHI
jgi:hypothetical protein